MGLVVHGYREQQGDHDKEDGEIDNTKARLLHLGHNYCHQDGHEDKVAKEKNVNKKNTKNELGVLYWEKQDQGASTQVELWINTMALPGRTLTSTRKGREGGEEDEREQEKHDERGGV